MFRYLSAWLLVLSLFVALGCGGGSDTNEVAENSSSESGGGSTGGEAGAGEAAGGGKPDFAGMMMKGAEGMEGGGAGGAGMAGPGGAGMAGPGGAGMAGPGGAGMAGPGGAGMAGPGGAGMAGPGGAGMAGPGGEGMASMGAPGMTGPGGEGMTGPGMAGPGGAGMTAPGMTGPGGEGMTAPGMTGPGGEGMTAPGMTGPGGAGMTGPGGAGMSPPPGGFTGVGTGGSTGTGPPGGFDPGKMATGGAAATGANPGTAGGPPAGFDPSKMAQGYGGGGAGGAPGAGVASGPPGGAAGFGAGAGAGAAPGGAGPPAGFGGPGGYGGGGAVAEAKPPEGFGPKADWAFKQGKDREAMRYLYAYGLTDDQAARSVLSGIQWIPGLKRPGLAVRFGAGVQVTVPPTFKGDPKAIGSTQKMPEKEKRGTRGGGADAFAGGAGGSGFPGAGGAGAPGGAGFPGGVGPGMGEDDGASDGSNATLTHYTGDLGEKVVEGIRDRLAKGDFGQALKKAASAAPAADGGGDGTGAGPGGFAGAGGGAAMAGMGAGMGGAGMGMPGGRGSAAKEGITVDQIVPGLTMLGVASQKDLLAKAKEEDLDVIVLFAVAIKPGKNDLVRTEAAFALIDVATGKRLHTGKKLINLDVQKARAANKDDGVEREAKRLFDYVDANLKMTALPAALNSANVLKRIGSLFKTSHENKLPILGEIRMYNVKGLLNDENLGKAYERVLGVDFGRLLTTGSMDDKTRALKQWLPEA